MSFEVEGRLHKKFETESKTDSFRAREFVIEVESQYPQFIKFQLVQDRCSLIDDMNEGDKIKVHFDLRGRQWQDKYFTNLNAWKVENAGDKGQPSPLDDPGFSEPLPGAGNEDESNKKEDFDDLPF